MKQRLTLTLLATAGLFSLLALPLKAQYAPTSTADIKPVCVPFNLPKATCDEEGNTVPSCKNLATNSGSGNETYVLSNTGSSSSGAKITVVVVKRMPPNVETCLEPGDPGQFVTIGPGDRLKVQNSDKNKKGKGTVKKQ